MPPYGPTGYLSDAGIGLVYMTHRHYDPSTGRFITRDPIGYNGGIGLYGFVRNNPVTRWDPNGTDPAYNQQKVDSLLRRTLNLDKDVKKRIGELHEDKLNLPEDAGPNAKPSTDRKGHRQTINEEKAKLDELQSELEHEVQKCAPDPIRFKPSCQISQTATTSWVHWLLSGS